MFQYQLILSYDGTRYFGWQKTKTGLAIQEVIEKALFRIGGIAPLPEAASRTDRGVHAKGQSVAIVLKKPWEENTLQKALNGSLPFDIRVVDVRQVPPEFHPTLDAWRKEYHYECCLSSVQLPIYRLYSWHLYKPLDLEKMEQGAKVLLGTHDFRAFANAPKKNSVCTLEKIECLPLSEERLRIKIQGNRFLYHMARNIVGTLVALGQRKISPEKVGAILASRDRKQGGVTAPAHGLTLYQIAYAKSYTAVEISGGSGSRECKEAKASPCNFS